MNDNLSDFKPIGWYWPGDGGKLHFFEGMSLPQDEQGHYYTENADGVRCTFLTREEAEIEMGEENESN
jgi:hypothetical protein